MRPSFRVKVGLLSALLSGVLLAGLGFYALALLNKVGRERVDRELRALADVQVRKEQPEGHWKRFDDSLRSLYGEGASRQFLVKVTRLDGSPVYASANWPDAIPDPALPLPLDLASPGVMERPPPDDTPPPPDPGDEYRPRPPDRQPQRRPPPRPMTIRGPVYATLAIPGGEWRAMTIANEAVTLSIAMSLSGLELEMSQFKHTLLIVVPLGLLLIIAGSWFVGNAALRPVRRLADTVESITASRLDKRLAMGTADDEFRRLIELFNGMLERLEKSFLQATRFSADAAHELKTPLAILQAQLEQALQRAPDGSPEQREAADQLDEIQRLRGILQKLLLLSQADTGELPLSPEPLDLAEVIRASADDIAILAPGRKVTITAPEHLMVTGDPVLLKQVIDNLVSNAVKFGDTTGRIAFELSSGKDLVIFRISNTGAPIPPGDHDRIFERFYRADSSHSRTIEGSGLGLSLAREIARAHGGELKLESSDDRKTTFVLTLTLHAGRAGGAGS